MLEVLPDFQHLNVGTELVQLLLSALREFYMIDLVCDTELLPFYERFGMRAYTAAILRKR